MASTLPSASSCCNLCDGLTVTIETTSGTNVNYQIIRDSPSTPEPDPADVTEVWELIFRNGAPGLHWDPVLGSWT